MKTRCSPLLPFIWSSHYSYDFKFGPRSSTLARKMLWTEDPGGLQSMGLLRVGHDWATALSRIGEGNGNPLQCSCLENPRDGGAWWAAIYGVTQSRTRLKQLSSSSCHLVLLLSFTVKCKVPPSFLWKHMGVNLFFPWFYTSNQAWKHYSTWSYEKTQRCLSIDS